MNCLVRLNQKETEFTRVINGWTSDLVSSESFHQKHYTVLSLRGAIATKQSYYNFEVLEIASLRSQ